MSLWKMREGRQSLKPFLEWLPLTGVKLLEIGCFAGDGTVEFLASDKIESVTCVDRFLGGYDAGDKASEADMRKVMLKWAHQVAHNNPERKPVTLHAYQTLDTAGLECRSLQFNLIYIDASHRLEDVVHDINLALELYPSIIAGHDYAQPYHPGVREAVDSFFHESQIIKFPDTSWAVVL